MNKREKDLWQGIDPAAQKALSARDYRTASFAQEVSERGRGRQRTLWSQATSRAKTSAVTANSPTSPAQKYTLGPCMADSTGLSNPVTLIGATPDYKLAIVCDGTGKMANVKFANIGVPLYPDGTFSTVKDWPRRQRG